MLPLSLYGSSHGESSSSRAGLGCVTDRGECGQSTCPYYADTGCNEVHSPRATVNVHLAQAFLFAVGGRQLRYDPLRSCLQLTVCHVHSDRLWKPTTAPFVMGTTGLRREVASWKGERRRRGGAREGDWGHEQQGRGEVGGMGNGGDWGKGEVGAWATGKGRGF